MDAIVLHWEQADEEHATGHGVPRDEIDDMVGLRLWIVTADPNGGPNRRFVIGPTSIGRYVTLVVHRLPTPGHFVPVTCWPSTPSQIAVYWRKLRAR